MRTPITLQPLLLSSLVACASGCHTPSEDVPGTPTDAVESPTSVDQRRELREGLLKDKPLEQAPLQDRTGSTVGEVPESLLERMRTDLSGRVGADRPLLLLRAESLVWPSGAMGCPVPGMTYTQALVPGYHVVFEVDGRRWDYRANQGGAFRLCEAAAPGLRDAPHPAA